MNREQQLVEQLTAFYREAAAEAPAVPAAWIAEQPRKTSWLQPVLASVALVVLAIGLTVGLRMARQPAGGIVTKSTPSTPAVTPSPSGFPTAPSIVGRIMRVSASGNAGTVGTLEISGTQPDGLPAEAIVTITSQTEIRLQGSTASKSFADLSTGQEVEVWFVGDVLQSYPEQARAGALTILTPRGP